MLGTGDAFCDWRVNYECNAVVDTDAGPVLIDCGMTAVQSMRELGIARHDLAAVLLTHVHPDHASLSALLLERFYTGHDGPAWMPTRLVTPPDVLDPARRTLQPHFDDALVPADGPADPTLGGVLQGHPALAWSWGGVDFRFFRVPHVRGSDARRGIDVDKPSYGIDIQQGGRRVIWTSDTRFQAAQAIAWARDPTVVAIFHDCSFRPAYAETVHTHFSELETLPADVKRKIVLTHHVQVPEGVDVSAYADAARRHQVFEL